nr:amidohydrolase family protein [Bacillus subtilis]
MSYLIKNGWILNENGEKTEADIRVTGETITAIGKLDATDNETVIDAKGLLVSPGFVDLHVHFREPGGEKKETIETGAKAAARGGYTTVAAMPNTRPVILIQRSRWNGCKTELKKLHASEFFHMHPLRSGKSAMK